MKKTMVPCIVASLAIALLLSISACGPPVSSKPVTGRADKSMRAPSNGQTAAPPVTRWKHNRRHFKKIREELGELHKEIDKIFFDLDYDPSEHGEGNGSETEPKPEKKK